MRVARQPGTDRATASEASSGRTARSARELVVGGRRLGSAAHEHRHRRPRRPDRPDRRGRGPRRPTLVQFFLGDPQGYKGPEVALRRRRRRRCGPTPRRPGVDLYVHAPYIVNVATTNNRIRIPSRKLLQQHVDAAAAIGAKGLIVHGGHVNDDDDPAIGFDNWRKAVERHRPQAAAADREHRRRRQRDDPLPRRGSPGSGTRSRRREGPTWSASASTPATPTPAATPLETVVDDVRAITGRIDLVHCNDSRDDVRLRRRPARQLRRRPDRPRPARRRRPRRRRPGGLRDPRRRRRARRRLRLAARALCDVLTAVHQAPATGSVQPSRDDLRPTLRPRSTSRSCEADRSASFLQTPAWGRGQGEWRRRVARLVRRGERAGRRGAGALPPAAAAQALPRLPARGPGHRLGDRRPRPPGSPRWPPTSAQGAFGVRMGPPGRHPALERRPGQGGHRRRRRTPPRRRRPDRARRRRRPRGRPAARAGLAAAGRRGRVRRRPAAVQLPDPAAPGRDRGRRPQGHEPAVAPQHQEGRQGGRRGHRRRRRRRRPRGASTTSTSTPPSATTSRRARCPTSAPWTTRSPPRTPTGSGSGSPATRATWWPPPSRSGSAPTPGTPTAPPPPRSATSAAPTPSSGR